MSTAYWERTSINDGSLIALYKVEDGEGQKTAYYYKDGKWQADQIGSIVAKVMWEDDYFSISEKDAINWIIKDKLRDIEKQENVKIILAIESGSRAWGFESEDSDYDVRFIYIRKTEDYLKLEPVRDVIEWQLDDVLDINGWDIRKALQLLYKSNPTLIEWCNSPIVYKHEAEIEEFKSLIPTYFSLKKSLYHYWHMAENTYRTHLTDEVVKLKKYFYALRPILAAKWILKKQTPPPMLFEELLLAELPEELGPIVAELLEKKRNSTELGTANKIPVLDEYIRNSILELKDIADNYEEVYQHEWNRLDSFFFKCLGI